VLKSAFPAETTHETVFRMTSTGVPVLDTRNNIIKPRIDLVAATNRTMAAYTISGGVVSPIGLPVAGVTMSLTGASVATTVTDANGDYNFADIASGSYTITPSEGIITFTPAFREIIVKGSNISVKTIIANIHAIKGRVFTASGKPVPGVTVTLGSDGSDIAMTDSDGRYVFSELGDGTYTITPEKDGYTFAPSSKTITVNGADRTGKSFTAITYAINGYVRNASGNPLQSVTVQLTGEVTKTKITDTNGFYRFGNLPEGNYVVTPNKASKTFEPASRNVTISSNNVQLQKFSVSP